MMGFLVITDEGKLEYCQRHPTPAALEMFTEVPAAWVRLHYAEDLCGYVADTSLAMPGTFPRNPVGTCLLVALGAGMQPYAGNVILCGWQRTPEPDAIDITPRQQTMIEDMQRTIKGLVLLGLASGHGPDWDTAMLDIATMAYEGDTPADTTHPYTGGPL